MFTSYSSPSMQRSQSESWDNEVEPLKIKSALTRRGSKAKLRGPREFSPLIGSSRPKKAVTFDRTDEIITYEQLTPEVYDDWRFNEQEYEIAESFEENPLHVLPSIPETTGIEKSMSEPSLHAALHENRLSRDDRLEAMMEASPIPSFRPGHKHNDSWRGSWGTIRESLGGEQAAQFEATESPRVEENYLFKELPDITRKESLQDEQRRPKTINMRPDTHKAQLDRSHSQRKRAIRSILENGSRSKNIATITEEEEPDTSRVSQANDECRADVDDSLQPPEIPPHAANPQLTIATSSPNASPNRASSSYLTPRSIPISPSLESVATFEANFASVERAESSFPVLTSVGNPSRAHGHDFNFEKTRTSTPSSHPLPNPPRRVPSPIHEVAETSNETDTASAAALKPSELPQGDIKFENSTADHIPEIVAALSPTESTSEGQEEDEAQREPQNDESARSLRINSWSRWETTEDVERAYMNPASDSEHSSTAEDAKEVSSLSDVSTTDVEEGQGVDDATPLALPQIPNRSSSQNTSINLPELSLSPAGLDSHMFDSSSHTSSSLHASHIIGGYSTSGSNASQAPNTSGVLRDIDSHPASLADANVSAISIPTAQSRAHVTPSISRGSINTTSFTPNVPKSASQLSMGSDAMPTSNSQRSIAGNNTYDFDSSTIAVHEKHYTSKPRPIAVQEEDEEEYKPREQFSVHVDARKAPPLTNWPKPDSSPGDARLLENTAAPEPVYNRHEDLDRILENSVTHESIHVSDHDSSVEALRPHPEFSFVETRNVSPLMVSPVTQTVSGEAGDVVDQSSASESSSVSRVSMKKSPELKVSADTQLKNVQREKADVSESVEHSVAHTTTENNLNGDGKHIEVDRPIAGPFESSPQANAPPQLQDSTSIEPLVIRNMDTTKDKFESGTPIDQVNVSRESSIHREASTNMISPPTPSQAFSNPGSRAPSGSSTVDNTVLHTPFADDSLLNYARRPAAPLGFSPDVQAPELNEKFHSPNLHQDELVLDSDLSEDEANTGENDWVTETESEFGSNRRIGGFSSSLLGSEYSSHIPGRIPTFQADSGRPVSASDIQECFGSERFSTNDFSSQAFGYPSTTGFSTGYSTTMPNSTKSRLSAESLREDSMFSMQLGQSMDDFSADLNRVASSATVDGMESDTGYVLRENDSLIFANSDRIFKTTRRRTTTRRKPAPAIESLETHQEEAEETNDYDQSLSVRKRDEQNSFASRQPSHLVMDRNATPQKAINQRSSSENPIDSDTRVSGEARVSSSNYGGSRDASAATTAGHRGANMSVELPDRSEAEVMPTAKISERSPQKDSTIHIDTRKAPPLLSRMADIEEVRETPQSLSQDKFRQEHPTHEILPPPSAEHHHMPRPASSYTPQVRDLVESGSAAKDTVRNRHKSCPVMPQEKGHLFISLESISGYTLPEGTMNITVDNGEQRITTEPRHIAKVTEFKQEYDLLVNDNLTCDVTIRAFKTETKEKRSNFAKLFKRKKESGHQYTPVARDGTIGHCKIHFKDIKQYAFGKPYSVSIPCYDRLNMNESCKVNVKMMYIPVMSRADKLPSTMSEALEEISRARREKVTAMSGYMVQHGGDCRNPKRRYFILDDDMLIAHSDKSFKARATINLRKAVYLAPDEDDSLKFRVNFRNGAFINFTVESERQKWMEALDTTIHNKRSRSSWVSLVVYADDSALKANAMLPQTVI